MGFATLKNNVAGGKNLDFGTFPSALFLTEPLA